MLVNGIYPLLFTIFYYIFCAGFFGYLSIYLLSINVFFDNCFDLKLVDFVEHFSPKALKIYVVYRHIAGRVVTAKFKNLSLDIDECLTKSDNCHSLAKCTNTGGNFTCICNIGFTGDGVNCAGKFVTDNCTQHNLKISYSVADNEMCFNY